MLHINGWVNIFYVRDQNLVLRVVDVSYYNVGAGSVGGEDGWAVGSQVFSRNIVFKYYEALVLA